MASSGSPRRASVLDAPAWHGRVLVVSPHLDDAVLSLGASIRNATRRGVHVDVLTVLAGDPASGAPSDESGRRAGFETVGEAARLRRDEDRAACESVGAEPRWLPLSDVAGAKPDLDVVAEELRAPLRGYDAVLLPGSPLAHADHRLISRAALAVLGPATVVGLYLEQPYASWEALARRRRGSPGKEGRSAKAVPRVTMDTLDLSVDGPPTWRRHAGRPADWPAKTRGMGAYVSQLRVLRRAPRTRILLYEAVHRGEAVCWMRLA